MTQCDKNETYHEKNCTLIRDIQLQLLATAEEEEHKNILMMPEFKGFNSKVINAHTIDDFSAWIPDTTVKPRKPDIITKVPKEKMRREAWRLEAKQKEIPYMFKHYSDPQQYIEQYRRSYTFHNFNPSRGNDVDIPKFVSLSRMPWAKNTQRQQLPPKLVNRIINDTPDWNNASLEKIVSTENSLGTKERTEQGLHRNQPRTPSSQPNSANTQTKRTKGNANYKPSLLELQHKYRLDPNAIKVTTSKMETPNHDNTQSGRSSAADSRTGSAKTFKEIFKGRTSVNLTQSSRKRENTEVKSGRNGHVICHKGTKLHNGFDADLRPL